jgi:catechol 2,3-dioxygenase-like lactoylglutathione lyase family enzyme
MTAQFGQCCYVTAVHDVAASQAYFVDKLAFEALDIDAPGWRFVQRGTARFDMGECIGVPEASTLGDHSWIARIFVEGLDDYHAEIAARGAEILNGPADKPWGLREMAVRTPDGHRIMFCEVIG